MDPLVHITLLYFAVLCRIFSNFLLTQMYVIIDVMTVAMVRVRIKVITNVTATAASVDNEPS